MLVAEGLQNSNLLFDGLAGLADKTDSLVDQHSESAGAQTLEPPKRVLVPQLQKDLITHDNFIDQKNLHSYQSPTQLPLHKSDQKTPLRLGEWVAVQKHGDNC